MDFFFSKIKEEIATANSISKTNLWLYLFTCKPYQLLLFLITCDIIFLHKIRRFDSFKFCWVFYQITMAYSLCKFKIYIYVFTVGICSYILPSINAMVNQNTDIKNKHLRKPAFKFYICLLLFKNCIFGYDGLFRGPLIDKEICTDWRQILLAISIYLFSLHNNNVIVRKRSINRWCYMVWCPLPFQYVWTTKESVLWMTCIKRYSKCNFNLPTNTAL